MEITKTLHIFVKAMEFVDYLNRRKFKLNKAVAKLNREDTDSLDDEDRDTLRSEFDAFYDLNRELGD